MMTRKRMAKLRKALRGSPCASCGGPTDRNAALGLLPVPTTEGQAVHPHLICVSCIAPAWESDGTFKEFADRTRLTLLPAEGEA